MMLDKIDCRSIERKFLEVLVAGCYGDALGYSVEFHSWNDIRRDHGILGIQRLQLEQKSGKAAASDDTQMTLFACQAINFALRDKNLSFENIKQHTRHSFLQWYETQIARKGEVSIKNSMFEKEHIMFKRQAPGNTCLSSLYEGANGTVDNPINSSKGCGAVMRAAPYSFLFEHLTVEEIWSIAAAQGALTHGHIEGWASAAALAYIMALMFKGHPLEMAIIKAQKMLKLNKAFNTDLLLTIASKMSLSPELLSPEELNELLGEGWTGDEALGIAIYSALTAKSVNEAVWIAANHDGDSDSTASIAGQLAALRFGLTNKEIEETKHQIDLGPLTIKVAEELATSLQIYSRKDNDKNIFTI